MSLFDRKKLQKSPRRKFLPSMSQEKSKILKEKAKRSLDRLNELQQWLPTRSVERLMKSERTCNLPQNINI